ncbi:MAG TPA: glycosyltransferase family 39 protein [Bryobacteraceae bacterium]|nr:glycosyltransferase family 39 protein [Bryobacteraceae bacterium]
MAKRKLRQREPASRPTPVEPPQIAPSWKKRHVQWLPLVIILLSLGIRGYYAATYHLNPDEGFNFLFAHQPSLDAVRLETLDPIHTYPPLYAFLLHFVLLFGDSEFMLRLPTLLFGTLFLAMGFLWMRRLLGYTAALTALLILAFSPGMVSIGYEVRNYALLMACIMLTFYALERAFAEQSRKWMAIAMASLYVAILTNYSAAWVCLVIGIYAAIRIGKGHLKRAVVREWLAWQLGAVGIYVWLYATHISILRGSASEAALREFLKESYYRPLTDSPLAFVWRQNLAVFQYLYEIRWVSAIALLLFLAGLWWLASGKDETLTHSRMTCFLLGFPPVLGCLLALAGLYPYGSSRHSAIFQPFLAAGAGYAIAVLVSRRSWLVPALALLLVPPWIVAAYRGAWYIPGPDETRTQMQAAMRYIRSLPKGTTIFADHATLIELGYYLGRDVYSPYHGRVNPVVEFHYDGYRILCPVALWSLSLEDFVPAFYSTMERYQTKSGDIWVFDYGSGNVAEELAGAGPNLRTRNLHWFGGRLALFQVVN